MSLRARDIEDFVQKHKLIVLVDIVETQGSTPRETGAFMLVGPDAILGTIGGGQLEYVAIASARRMLTKQECMRHIVVPLGPELGQCCGGQVRLSLQILDGPIAADLTDGAKAAEAAEPLVMVFGAGHVGRALARALAPLHFQTTIADTRPGELRGLPETVVPKLAALPEALVRSALPGSAFVVLTHDHALDFLVMREVLMRGDAAYAGLIGSKSKRAKFCHWFLGEGGTRRQLESLVCPIGAGAPGDKRPEMIAALVAAELVVCFNRQRQRADLVLAGGTG